MCFYFRSCSCIIFFVEISPACRRLALLFFILIDSALHSRFFNVKVTYQTQETVFHRDIQTSRRELKIRRAAEY